MLCSCAHVATMGVKGLMHRQRFVLMLNALHVLQNVTEMSTAVKLISLFFIFALFDV